MSDTVQPKDMNLYQKLAAITGEIGAVAKGGRNQQQNFDFIEYAAVAGNLRGLFSKYGVVIVPRMQRAQKQQREPVKDGKGVAVLIDFYFTVVNADKPEDKFNVAWTGEAIDYGDKATNKAATSALKYYLMRQFNISEKGEDPDAHSPERQSAAPSTKKVASDAPAPITDKQKDIIRDLGRQLGMTEETLDRQVSAIKSSSTAFDSITVMKAKLKEKGDSHEDQHQTT